MADTVSAVYEFILPEVGASDDTWGTKLNADLAKLEALLVSGFDGGSPSGIGTIKGSTIPVDLGNNHIFGPISLRPTDSEASVSIIAFNAFDATPKAQLFYSHPAEQIVLRTRIDDITGAALTMAHTGAITWTGEHQGISFGSSVAPAADNVNRHINLFGGSYGFSVVSNVLSAVYPSSAIFQFRSGGTLDARIDSAGTAVPAVQTVITREKGDNRYLDVGNMNAGLLAIARGGTNAANAATARTNLGANNASNLNAGTLPSARLPADSAANTWVHARYASIAANAVGSLALAYDSVSRTTMIGGTRPGSDLNPTSAGAARADTTLPGTWRCLGYATTGDSDNRKTLWMRVS